MRPKYLPKDQPERKQNGDWKFRLRSKHVELKNWQLRRKLPLRLNFNPKELQRNNLLEEEKYKHNWRQNVYKKNRR